jgi:hypothetical protein
MRIYQAIARTTQAGLPGYIANQHFSFTQMICAANIAQREKARGL